MLNESIKSKILMFFMLVLAFLYFSEINSSNSAEDSTQSQPQTKSEKAEGGWQIFEIEYPKTPEPRDCAASVYDGTLFYMFSGTNSYYKPELTYKDFWYYNPETDLWHEIEVPDFVGGRFEANMFCIKGLLIIYGGYRMKDGRRVNLNDGYIINSTIQGYSWNKITNYNPPKPTEGYSAIATDDKMIVFGGIDEKGNFSNDCKSFDPVKNDWEWISTPDNLLGRYKHNALWTGEKMLITGGVKAFNTLIEEQEKWSYKSNSYEKVKVPVNHDVTTKQSAVYDPKSKSWEIFTIRDARASHTAVWTGSFAILWGGYSGDGKEAYWEFDTIIVFENNDGKFVSSVRDENILPARCEHAAFWTGKEMLIGFGDNPSGDGESPLYRSGGLYDVSYNKWIIPRNCPFTIYNRARENQTFISKDNVIYNFTGDRKLCGKYIPDRDIFLTGLGNGFQPQFEELEFVDTPQGIFASRSYWYINGRITTYAFWKFDENIGKFKRIDQDRKDILLDKCTPLWRNEKICFNTSLKNPQSLYCQEGILNIYDDAKKNWITPQTDGVVPIDRYLCAQAVNDQYIFVVGGLFSAIRQYSENFDIAWERRIPNTHFSLEHWYRPWFNEQSRVSKQSKTYPILDDGFVYSFKENRWKKINTANSPAARLSALACPIDEKFAVFGGFDNVNDNPSFIADKYNPTIAKMINFDGGIYDPKTDKWEKITELKTDKIKIKADTFKNLRISQFGKDILLYKLNPYKGYREDIHDDFFGFVYDVDKLTWTELMPPNKNIAILDEIVNFNGKLLFKTYVKSDADEKVYEYFEKWFLFEAQNSSWTECAMNNMIQNGYKRPGKYERLGKSVDNTKYAIFKNKFIFYTNTPITDEKSSEKEQNASRYVLRINSYDPAENKVTQLSQIETNIENLRCETELVNKLNSNYNRDRICFIGKNDDDCDEHYRANKLFVLIYNFPD